MRRQEQRESPDERLNGVSQYSEETNGTPRDERSPSITKSNSVVYMFKDRVRRAQDGGVKRAESMKVGQKPIKRTPSFTTRRRGSLRSTYGYFNNF